MGEFLRAKLDQARTWSERNREEHRLRNEKLKEALVNWDGDQIGKLLNEGIQDCGNDIREAITWSQNSAEEAGLTPENVSKAIEFAKVVHGKINEFKDTIDTFDQNYDA